MLKGKKAVVKVSLAILSLFIVVLVAVYAGVAIANTHTSVADLEPEWSVPNATNNYTVKITNTGGNSIDEVRIMQNPAYTDLVCEEKTDWNLIFVPDFPDPELGIVDMCWYYTDDAHAIPEEDSEVFEFSAKSPTKDPKECALIWKFETRDVADFWRFIYDTTNIDSEPPITTKKYLGPQKIENNLEWIDGITEVELTAEDMSEECGIGVNKTYYRVSGALADRYCYSCEDWMTMLRPDMGDWITYTDPFGIDDESCHVIEYYSDDLLGNEEDIKWQCVFVDKTAPEMNKEVGLPNIPCEPTGEPTCEGTPETEACYFYTYEQCEVIPGCLWDYGEVIPLGGETNGVGECVGTPELTCSELERTWQGKCLETPGCEWIRPEPDCDYWVRDDTYMDGTPITLSCVDPEPHPSGDEEVCFRVSYDIEPWLTRQYCEEAQGTMGVEADDWCCVDVSENPLTIIFKEDSVHDLEYFCKDAVNKKSKVDLEYFKVDSLPPIIEKDMFGKYLGDCPEGTDLDHGDCYVSDNGENGVDITVYDDPTYPQCAVEGLKCYYELWWRVGREECADVGEFNPDKGMCLVDDDEFSESARVVFNEDSTHELYIYCEDALGNYVEDTEIFLVDSTPPITTKRYNPDSYFDDNPWEYIDTVHEVILEAEDAKVGVDEIRYRVSGSLADDFCQRCEAWRDRLRPDMGDWITYTDPFGIEEESCHVIEYSSVDKLGNEEDIKWQCVFVDKTKPETTKMYEPDAYIDKTTGYEYIDTTHTIILEAEDLGPHPSGVAEIQYRVSTSLADKFCEQCGDWMTMLRPDMGPWNTYKEPFGIKDESCHVIEYRSIDNVGKIEDTKWQCVFVDKTAPEIKKTYEGPQVGTDGAYPHYINSDTDIVIEATDPLPHPSGVAKVKYRIRLVDDVACESEQRCEEIQLGEDSWIPYEDPFNIEEDSCHVIEIMATDNVGKYSTHRQCVFVDNKAPEVEKTIEGDNKIEAKEPVHMYLTDESTITLTCTDQEPHPVEGETIYWEMYWKFDDCAGETGWESVDSGSEETGIKEFTGLKDSCHKFVYWCEDALGNSGEPEVEIDIVDNQPPTPVKVVGDPKTEWNGLDSDFYPWIKDKCRADPEIEDSCPDGYDCIDCWKVTLDTPISMKCEDPEPHPVDNEKICFQVELDGTDWTGVDGGYCNHYEGQMVDDFCCLDKIIEDFTFLESSEHNLKFYCVDALGNTNEEVDEEKFKVEGNNFTIKINKKWNLISVPVVLLNPDITEVIPDSMGDKIISVWAYDPTLALCGEEWCVYTPDGNPDNDDLHELVPGWGYWVLALDETEIVIGGSLLSPRRRPPSRNLVEGWNLVGYYGLDGQTGYYGPLGNGEDVACALGTLCGPLWFEEWGSVATFWQPESNPWVYLGRYDGMDPGAGYWVFMRDEGEYTKATSCCSILGS